MRNVRPVVRRYDVYGGDMKDAAAGYFFDFQKCV